MTWFSLSVIFVTLCNCLCCNVHGSLFLFLYCFVVMWFSFSLISVLLCGSLILLDTWFTWLHAAIFKKYIKFYFSVVLDVLAHHAYWKVGSYWHSTRLILVMNPGTGSYNFCPLVNNWNTVAEIRNKIILVWNTWSDEWLQCHSNDSRKRTMYILVVTKGYNQIILVINLEIESSCLGIFLNLFLQYVACFPHFSHLHMTHKDGRKILDDVRRKILCPSWKIDYVSIGTETICF